MPSFVLPPPPPPTRSGRLSLVALLAPVLMAGALWLATRAPAALLFAAVGPLLAGLGWGESWARARAGRRRDRRDRARALLGLRAAVAQAQEAERVELGRVVPGAGRALAAPRLPVLWAGPARGAPPLVRVGEGVLRSAVRVGGEPTDEAERILQQEAARLDRAPIAVAVDGLVALCGQRAAATALLRALAVQLAATTPPGARALALHPTASAALDVEERAWFERLPHVDREDAERITVFALVDGPEQAPPGCALVVEARADRARVLVGAPEGMLDDAVAPGYLSRAQASAFAEALAERAERSGFGPASRLPERVLLGELPAPAAAGGDRAAGLAAAVGREASGVALLDLVADGPHAVVAGVTGAGKSELLVSWIAAMARAHGPEALNVLLIDFKGGTAFAPLAVLPHTVGVVTDLAPVEAARALRSLAAELRRREAVLAALGARDVVEAAGRMPRLVVVVDEFAALLEAFPDFAALFADIAARGRALGLHLVLATQRLSGTVREGLLANCPLRIALRLPAEADSRAIVGTDAAARLRAAHPGRAVVAVDGRTRTVQFALTDPGELARIAASWGGAGAGAGVGARGGAGRGAGAEASSPNPGGGRAIVRRPWAPPLPARLTRAELEASVAVPPDDALLLGLADAPELQGREAAVWSDASGSLLVVGAARSGKSSLLRLIAESAAAREDPPQLLTASAERERAWDLLDEAMGRGGDGATGESPARRILLLLDDVDALLARYGEKYAAEWAERLSRVLRDGPARGIRCVVAAQRLSPPLRPLAELAGDTVLLRLPTRQDHLLMGGSAALYEERMPPGGGVWHGRRVQFLAPGEESADGASAAATMLVRRPARLERVSSPPGRGALQAIVARAPLRLIESLIDGGLPAEAIVDLAAFGPLERPDVEQLRQRARDASSLGLLVVADPDTWQLHWPLFAALRARTPVVFVGCDAAELRALARSRLTPPPLDDLPGRCWVLQPDGTVRRGALG